MKTMERSTRVKKLIIEVTNYCNLSCMSCPNSVMERPRGYMDDVTFNRIVGESIRVGVRSWVFGFGGEPLLHPRIIDFIRRAKSSGIAVSVSTNAVCMTEEFSQALLETQLDGLHTSFYGLRAETDCIIRRQGSKEVLQNVLQLVESLRRNTQFKTALEIQMIVGQHNIEEILPFMAWWKKRLQGIRHSEHLFCPISRWTPAMHGYLLHAVSNPKHPSYCGNLKRQLAIFWNGDISICCSDILGRRVLANINTAPLDEIWQSEELEEINRAHAEGCPERIDLCSNCENAWDFTAEEAFIPRPGMRTFPSDVIS